MTTTITLSHLPPHALHLSLLLSLSPSTAARLRTGLTTQDPAFEYAFLDARAVLSRTHVLAGAFQALRNALVAGKVRTRNVHSEIVFCMGGNNNITEAFKRFGISEGTRDVLCIKVSTPQKEVSREDVEEHLRSVMGGDGEGVMAEVTDEALKELVDLEVVRKNYKIKGGGGGGGDGKQKERKREGVTTAGAAGVGILDGLEVEVLGKMVVRVVG